MKAFQTHRHLREVDTEIRSLILLDALDFNLLCALLKVTSVYDDCVGVSRRTRQLRMLFVTVMMDRGEAKTRPGRSAGSGWPGPGLGHVQGRLTRCLNRVDSGEKGSASGRGQSS